MKITRTYDIELIRSVVTSEAFWDAVTEDGQEKEHYEPNLQKNIWLKLEGEGRLIALVDVEPLNGVTLIIHPMRIIKEAGSSEEIMKRFVEWFGGTDYKKLIAEIPEIYPHVINFVKWAGFSLEGIRTSSYLKNGALHDVYLYGATIQEINKRFL